jgi:hypothetical protein
MALNVTAARVEAVFASTLQASDKPTGQQIRYTISNVVRVHGSRRIAALVAQEFGDHPDTALERMRWARRVVGEVYERPARTRHLSRTAS